MKEIDEDLSQIIKSFFDEYEKNEETKFKGKANEFFDNNNHLFECLPEGVVYYPSSRMGAKNRIGFRVGARKNLFCWFSTHYNKIEFRCRTIKNGIRGNCFFADSIKSPIKFPINDIKILLLKIKEYMDMVKFNDEKAEKIRSIKKNAFQQQMSEKLKKANLIHQWEDRRGIISLLIKLNYIKVIKYQFTDKSLLKSMKKLDKIIIDIHEIQNTYKKLSTQLFIIGKKL